MNVTSLLLMRARFFDFAVGAPDIASECCQLGRQWAVQSHHLCGPYPAEMMSDAVALNDDVMSAILCISAVDACCVVERRAVQCEAGRQTALNEHSCHGLHLYQSAEDAKVTIRCYDDNIVFGFRELSDRKSRSMHWGLLFAQIYLVLNYNLLFN